VIKEDGTIPGSSWIIPATLSGKLDQDAVVLKASTKQKAAQLFLKWLRTDPAALKLIRAAGYLVAARPSGAPK
jgi:molybdate transport system substrate-binding protein